MLSPELLRSEGVPLPLLSMVLRAGQDRILYRDDIITTIEADAFVMKIYRIFNYENIVGSFYSVL